MQQVTINRFDPTIGFVPIPHNAKNIAIEWSTTPLNDNCYVLVFDTDTTNSETIKLPPGKWKILFRHSDYNINDLRKIINDGGLNSDRFVQWVYDNWLRAHSIQLIEHQDLLILKKVGK